MGGVNQWVQGRRERDTGTNIGRRTLRDWNVQGGGKGSGGRGPLVRQEGEGKKNGEGSEKEGQCDLEPKDHSARGHLRGGEKE